jgi:hypothetical protein
MYVSMQRSLISEKKKALGFRLFSGFARLSVWYKQHVNEDELRSINIDYI